MARGFPPNMRLIEWLARWLLCLLVIYSRSQRCTFQQMMVSQLTVRSESKHKRKPAPNLCTNKMAYTNAQSPQSLFPFGLMSLSFHGHNPFLSIDKRSCLIPLVYLDQHCLLQLSRVFPIYDLFLTCGPCVMAQGRQSHQQAPSCRLNTCCKCSRHTFKTFSCAT